MKLRISFYWLLKFFDRLLRNMDLVMRFLTKTLKKQYPLNALGIRQVWFIDLMQNFKTLSSFLEGYASVNSGTQYKHDDVTEEP